MATLKKAKKERKVKNSVKSAVLPTDSSVLEAVVKVSDDAIIEKTLDGIIMTWNKGAEKQYGYTAKEAVGKLVSLLIPKDRFDELPKFFQKIKKGEIVEHYETERLRKDGKKIEVSVSIAPVRDSAGNIVGATSVSRSIPEQKEVDETLRQIQLVVENSNEAIISETLDGVITSWNGGAVKMFGYNAKEVIGKSVSFLLPPELRGEISVLLGKNKVGEVIAYHETVRLHKNGSKIDVALSSSPIKNEKGEVIGVSIVERDITTRKKEEEVLRQIKLIVENSRDAIIGKTLDGIITSWNGGAVKMFGYTPEEVIGKSMTSLFPPELKDELPGLLEKVKKGEIIADYDSVWLRKDGTKADVEFSISPVYKEDGKIAGASLVGRDISERMKSERHIKELNEVRNKFISIISHQLRTPLTSVNWNLEMLLNGDFGKLDDTARKFLKVTHTASVEITHRIHDLLTAMDIEEGRVKFEKEAVSLDSITAAVVNEMSKACELKNVSCNYVSPEKDLPAIQGDGEKLRLVVMKLIDNAIIYTKEGGKITVKLEKIGKAVKFEVKDNGIGVPKPEQHHLFTRFFRASNAATMQPDAFGLGLFIAKSFIEQHGGKTGFESKEGKGSVFWFEIPLKN